MKKRIIALLLILLMLSAAVAAGVGIDAGAAGANGGGTAPGSASADSRPIVVIPGVMGSRLFKSETVFTSATKAWEPTTLKQLDSLSVAMESTLYVRPCENQNVDPDSDLPDSTVDEYGREYGAGSAYQRLVDSLCSAYSYLYPEQYRPVYFFSYDWRGSNTVSAESLKLAIEKITAETGCEKVDLVCHSMGGLVASAYYASYASEERVGKIITCGTPYEGAPTLINSVMNWDVLGQGFDITSWDAAKSSFGDLILGSFGGLTKKLKASFAGVAELTPTVQYADRIAMQRDASDGYQTLTAEEYLDACREIFGDLYDEALAFQDSIRSPGGVNVLLDYEDAYFCIGVGYPTVTSIRFKKSSSKIDERLYESDVDYDTLGDGTVPYLSASMTEEIPKLTAERWRCFDADHGGLVEENAPLNWIISVLDSGDRVPEPTLAPTLAPASQAQSEPSAASDSGVMLPIIFIAAGAAVMIGVMILSIIVVKKRRGRNE